MKLSISNIANQGNRDKEVVTLKVTEGCNLQNYILTDATYTKEEELARPFRHTFWFAPTEVKTGDYVMVHSRAGVATHTPNQLGTTSHQFFWNQTDAIWHDDDAAILYEVASWDVQQTRSFASFV